MHGLVLLLFLLIAGTAEAHEIGLSRSDWTLHGNDLDGAMVMSSAEPIDPSRMFVGDGCTQNVGEKEPTEGDGSRVHVHFTCPTPPRILRFDFVEGGHKHLVHVEGDRTIDAIATASQREIAIGAPKETGFFAMVRLGIEHILTGWDHLAFLLGLVVVGGRWRSILAAVTAFTIAHSITLGLAAFGVVRGAPLFVEPLIALSVVYVGVENFRAPTIEGRWRITLPFGLIHGFGFASALANLELARPKIPMALFSFNLGVEIGQLAVLALVLPILWLLRKSRLFQKWGVRGISAMIVAAGVIWFAVRVSS